MKFFILISFCFISCQSVPSDVPIYKKSINDCDINIIEDINYLGITYNPEILKRIEYNDIEYFVKTSYEDSIVYVVTWDKKFITPDSVRVGDTLKQIKEKSKFVISSFDNFKYKLDSGWYVIIKFEGYREQEFPDDSSRVWWFKIENLKQIN